jgi:flagellin-like hook-associated protein FlgL
MTITRISNLASNNQLVSLLLKTQARLQNTQIQVGSEKKSQDYGGLGSEAERLVSIENQTKMLERYKRNNELADMRLSAQETTLSGIKTTIRQFREKLYTYQGGSLTDKKRVEDIQKYAFQALKDIQAYLNTDLNGEYLFGGGRTRTKPVDFGLTTLAAFQSTYDGSGVLYPVTRAANVETSVSLGNSNTGNLTISGTNVITAATAGSLASIPVGAKITISGSVLGNDGTYTVVSNSGTAISINGTMSLGGTSNPTVTNSIANGTETAATITVSNYYQGDNITQTHRASKNQSFTFDVNAIDPAFEKAIRAMGTIAQGSFGTTGGLDQNTTRLDDSIDLMSLSLGPAAGLTKPYGAETDGHMEQVEQDNGFDRVLVDRLGKEQTNMIGFFDARAADIENIDKLDAVTRLMADSRVLETSYQALARISKLSLSNYL